MEQSLRGRVNVLSDWTWRGIRGAPTSLSNTMNSLFDGADDISEDGAFMRVRRLCHRLKPLVPKQVSISSGIGTSSTVSNPSALSKLGHNFLMDWKQLEAQAPERDTDTKRKTRKERMKKEGNVSFLSLYPMPQQGFGLICSEEQMIFFVCNVKLCANWEGEAKQRIAPCVPFS